MDTVAPQRAMRYGWLACWVFIVFFFAINAVRYIATSVSYINLPERYMAPVETAVYYLLFLVFLFGVRGFALQKSDADLTKTLNTLILVNIAEMIMMYPYSFSYFIEQNFLSILLVALIPLICINGIVLVRLAEGFSKYTPELGVAAKRITWWNKIAGWMFASVILAIPGLIAALVGEFFLWRLLAKSRSDSGMNSTSPVIAAGV
ncbi:MAG: hypothetical protein UY63_C0008G0011 [Parcubacteria group bacterium GW2011_GWA2_51_10]|nr:MAG: hypothetical protein UY63_C0008G0011 [Parcubacteria group bacterium GW2011_GWA2_51_10]